METNKGSVTARISGMEHPVANPGIPARGNVNPGAPEFSVETSHTWRRRDLGSEAAGDRQDDLFGGIFGPAQAGPNMRRTAAHEFDGSALEILGHLSMQERHCYKTLIDALQKPCST